MFKKIIAIISLLMLFNTNSLAMNSAFKATFVETDDISLEEPKIELFEPKYIDVLQKQVYKQRVLEEEKQCVVDRYGNENCTDNLIQCNKEFLSSEGDSVEHKKTLVVNKILVDGKYSCPETYIEMDNLNAQSSLCKKEYSYHTYSCPSQSTDSQFPWIGPLVDTGYDCLGYCGESGCVCNESIAPQKNCIKENYKCPLGDANKCTEIKSDEYSDDNSYKFTQYSLGFSKTFSKTISKPVECKEGFSFNKNTQECESLNSPIYNAETRTVLCSADEYYNGTVCAYEPTCKKDYYYEEGVCKKDYTYNEYTCEEGYDIQSKGADCLGKCIGNNCQCNSSTPPKNNCSIAISNKKSETVVNKSLEVFDLVEFKGAAGETFENEFNKKEEPILTIQGEGFKLCFESKNKKECIANNQCFFEGESDVSKEIKISEKSINEVTSSCELFGFIGDGKTNITTVSPKGNKLVFSNIYEDKYLGEIQFLSKDEKRWNPSLLNKIKEGKKFFTHKEYIYYVENDAKDLKECRKIAKELNGELELIFKDKDLKNKAALATLNNYDLLIDKNAKCITKIKNDIDFNMNEKINETKKLEGNTIYACSPLSCVDGKCQKASCPDGFDGTKYPKGYDLLDSTCQDQVCDANKDFTTYCGNSVSKCDPLDPSLIINEDGCQKAVCDKGEFNTTTKMCEIAPGDSVNKKP